MLLSTTVLLRRAVLTGALVLGARVVSAQGPGSTQPPPPPFPKPLVPVAASTLAAHPDPYVGEYVSLTAVVEEQLSPLAFVVDQDKNTRTGQDVLVLARRLNRPLEPHTYVTVVGQVVRFDPAALSKEDAGVLADLPPGLLDRFRGRPAILAMNVVTAAGEDLSRRLPPPMSPAEERYARTMKEVGQAQTALRKALESTDVRLARDQAAALKQAFDEVGRFWKGRGQREAARWAREARTLVESLDRAVAAARWEDVKTAAGSLGQVCQRCHAAYRERFDDGSFRIRIPEGAPRTR